MRINRQRRRSGEISFETLEWRNLLAATPQLLGDINQEESAFPRDLFEFAGRLFYTVDHPEYGRELWSSDGTPEGTQLVKDIYPGSFGSGVANFVTSGEWLYFTASDPEHGSELWRTDGTTAGTQLYFDSQAGSSGGMPYDQQLVDVGGSLYFVSFGINSTGKLWKTDGVQAPNLVLSLASPYSVRELTAVGDTLFFARSDSDSGGELWKSDGSPAGTMLVKDIYSGLSSSWPQGLTAFDGEVYFEAFTPANGYRLWKSDGTADGTVLVPGAQAFTPYTFSQLVVSGDTLYFSGNSGGYVLWAIDGHDSPVRPVLSNANFSNTPDKFVAVDDTLYFQGDAAGVYSLWKTDGTTEGTEQLAELEQDGIPLILGEMAAYQGELFFATYAEDVAVDLWRSNGTPAGTYRTLASIAPSSSALAVRLGAAGSHLFFAGNNQGTGVELWRTDGSTRYLLQDLSGFATDSSNPQNFVTTSTHVFFEADNGTSKQLYAAPGPDAAPVRITLESASDARVEQLTPVGSLLYFVATDWSGQRYLGVSDGTQAGTHRLNLPFAPNLASIHGITAFAGGVIFVVYDEIQGLLVCRASAIDVQLVHALGPDSHVGVNGFGSVIWQGDYYFTASQTSSEIWRTDGTSAGTQSLHAAVPGLGAFGHSLTATDSALYFVSPQQGQTPPILWRTDGTVAGSYNYWFMPAPDRLIGAGNYLYFVMPGPPGWSGQYMLWGTDGTIPGTRPLAPYFALGDYPLDPTAGVPMTAVLNDELYFFNPSPVGFGPIALWKTDGTPAGTTHVADLPFGWNSSWGISESGGELFILAQGVLYRSDGTTAGTRAVVFDFGIDPADAVQRFANKVVAHGETLYFGYPVAGFGVEPVSYVPDQSSVVGRRLFYNGSEFDESSVALDYRDEYAIASDKTPYFAGSGLATFENISSYSRGINGVMIDLANLPPAFSFPNLTLEDFAFRVGSSNDLNTWTTAPAPAEIALSYPTGNPTDLTRVSLRWENNAIQNTWLEITVLANARTGLAQPDVFYFGNRIGDTGSGTPTAATTTAADELLVRNNTAPNQWITSTLDFNRDQAVTATDALIARGNIGILRKLDLPANGVPALDAAAPLAAVIEQVEKRNREESLSAPAAKPFSRADLLAWAVQSWNEWLDVEEEELVTGLHTAGRSRR